MEITLCIHRIISQTNKAIRRRPVIGLLTHKCIWCCGISCYLKAEEDVMIRRRRQINEMINSMGTKCRIINWFRFTGGLDGILNRRLYELICALWMCRISGTIITTQLIRWAIKNDEQFSARRLIKLKCNCNLIASSTPHPVETRRELLKRDPYNLFVWTLGSSLNLDLHFTHVLDILFRKKINESS